MTTLRIINTAVICIGSLLIDAIGSPSINRMPVLPVQNDWDWVGFGHWSCIHHATDLELPTDFFSARDALANFPVCPDKMYSVQYFWNLVDK